MYYRNAAAAIVCFGKTVFMCPIAPVSCVYITVDITNEDSFSKMKDWVEELQQNVSFHGLSI